ncbi:hypothetical protein XENTR_v10012229 [Xenopus tropicalis]|uniref:Myocilin n=1 Tax=Xenopus tropicalis TaxID=8364 RepID=A0A6I8QYV5_XENTR|nr:myocilin [Xenopus tropicalis]KAE8610746.1 hypothetical protein XENTR_v10012229 [Xenopus tropicalis]
MGSLALHIVVALWVAQGISGQFRRTSDGSGQCTYSFTVPSATEGGCTEPAQAKAAIQDLQREVSVRHKEMEGLQIRLGLLEKLVNRLLGGEGLVKPSLGPQAGADLQLEVQKLRMEKDEWEGQRGSLEMAYADLLKEKESLEEEKQQLSQRLERDVQGQCPQVPGSSRAQAADSSKTRVPDTSRVKDQQAPSRQVSRWGADPVGYQELKSELTALPASRMIPETQSTNHSSETIRADGACGELTWIGEPTTYRKADNIAGKYGVWMKDPKPLAPYTLDTVWRVNTVGADIRQVFEYENIDQLIKGYPGKVYVLPRSMESNGAVVYKGSLYYPRRKSRILVKYDFKTESVAVQREIPNAGYQGQYPYSWGGYTDIDLAVDEVGLWVIYSTEKAKGSIVLSLLDSESLEVKQSWETQIRKQSVANAFMICGTLYTVGSYSSSSTTVNFAFDTSTGVQRPVGIPFKNQYGYASMIDYNPTEKKIYGWDNFNMVAYDVRLSKM